MRITVFALAAALVGVSATQAFGGLISGQSMVRINSSMSGVLQSVEDSQPLPTGPLSTAQFRAGPGGGSLAMSADAVFHSPYAGTVQFEYVRDELGNSFGADANFYYSFTVDESTTVRFDYDVTNTTTDTTSVNGNLHPRIWWAMGPLSVAVGGQQEFLPYDLGDFPAPASPVIAIGSIEIVVPAGAHQLHIRLPGGAATGDFPGIRTISAEMSFQIIPEPSTILLSAMAALSALMISRAVRCRRGLRR